MRSMGNWGVRPLDSGGEPRSPAVSVRHQGGNSLPHGSSLSSTPVGRYKEVARSAGGEVLVPPNSNLTSRLPLRNDGEEGTDGPHDIQVRVTVAMLSEKQSQPPTSSSPDGLESPSPARRSLRAEPAKSCGEGSGERFVAAVPPLHGERRWPHAGGEVRFQGSPRPLAQVAQAAAGPGVRVQVHGGQPPHCVPSLDSLQDGTSGGHGSQAGPPGPRARAAARGVAVRRLCALQTSSQ